MTNFHTTFNQFTQKADDVAIAIIQYIHEIPSGHDRTQVTVNIPIFG